MPLGNLSRDSTINHSIILLVGILPQSLDSESRMKHI